MLDFDDLIERVVYLFTTGAEMDWVLYKLDANISHILVDESQDTNSEQWVIVKKLCEEFFVGSSSQDCKRTLFAVGDKKQSIFSFQGAKPSLFGQSGVEIKLKAKAAKKSFNQALATKEDDIDALLWLVRGALSAQENKEAEQYLNRAFAISGDNAEAWVLKGRVSSALRAYRRLSPM